MNNLARGDKKLLNAWAFYDWANSVYSLTIVSTIFPIFYGLLFRTAGLTHIALFRNRFGFCYGGGTFAYFEWYSRLFR